MSKRAANIWKLAVSLALPLAAGAAGGIVTAPAIGSGWYAALAKPALVPPNWVFGPVWTTLYILMGMALFLVWQHTNKLENVGMLHAKRVAFLLFALQLGLNVLWSAVFFGLHSVGGGLWVIAVLWCAIVATALIFARLSRVAALILLPYLAWVSFASYLNYALWALN